MAFYEEDDDQQQQDGQAAPAPTAPGGATIQGQGAVPAQNAPKTPDKGSSNFVGIQTYLNANKPQASKLGDQAAGVINQSADTAKQSLTGLQDSFNQKAGSGLASDQNALSKVGQAETLNDQEKQTLKNQYSAQYTGPSDLMSGDLGNQYQQTSQNLNKAQQNIQGSGTEAGRMNLISQVNNKARTQGQTTFDNALLSAGEGRQKLASAAAANKDVGASQLESANMTAVQKAQANKALTDATRQQTQEAVSGATNALNQGIDQRLQAAIQNGLGLNNRVVQDVTDNSLDEDIAGMYGLQEGDSTYGLSLGDYLTQADPTSVNRAGIASADDYARSQALAELSGQPGALNQADVAMAGTAKAEPKVDREKFQADKAGKEQAFKKQMATPGGYHEAAAAVGTDIPVLDHFLDDIGFGGITPEGLESQLERIMSSDIPLPPEVRNNWPAFQDKYRADVNEARQKIPAMLARMKQAAGQSQQVSYNKKG